MIAAFLAFSVMKLKEHVTKDKEFQEHQKCSEISLEVILLPNRSHLNAIYIYIYMYIYYIYQVCSLLVLILFSTCLLDPPLL